MRKVLSTLFIGIMMTVALVTIPSKVTKANATDDGYVLRQQANDLYNQALRERDDAYRQKDNAQNRVDDLRNSGISGDQLNKAYDELDDARRNVSKKEDKVSKARYVLDFVNSRNESEIFLAGMQEKFRNQASLKPMQDKIDGANAVISAQQTHIMDIQKAIVSQQELAKINPAMNAQVLQLQAMEKQEQAQLQQQIAARDELVRQYNVFAATMPMPTAADNMKLSEIRSDFRYACQEFDEACKE